jgi:hypothetical protein
MIRRLLLIIAIGLLLIDGFVFHGTYLVHPFQVVAIVPQPINSPGIQELANEEAAFTFDPFMVGGGLLILTVILISLSHGCTRGSAHA